MGREGADPRRRTRQGRRRPDREHARGDRRARRPDARVHARDAPDRGTRAARQPAAGRARLADRARVLPLALRRPRLATGRRDRERRGRRRHRGRRGARPRRDPHGVRRSRCRSPRLPVPKGRRRDRPGQPDHVVHAPAQAHLPPVPRHRLPAARDQPVHRGRGRRAGRARLQDELRRQRAVPAGRHRRAPRLRRGGPEGGRGLGSRPELHRARRHRGLHRERRRPGDGDDGRDRAPRRPPGELPGRGRRRQPREDRERVPHRAEGPERARDPGEHLRGDQPVRLDRAGRGAGDARPVDRRPRDRAPGRDQRRGGPGDPGRERPVPDPGRGPRRRGAQGRGGRGSAQEVPA